MNLTNKFKEKGIIYYCIIKINKLKQTRYLNMKDLDYYETKFKEYGWNKYLSSLYEWYIQGKDIKELAQLIVKIENQSNPLPNIRTDGKAKVKCDSRGYRIKAPKSTKIFVGAQKGFNPMFDGKRAWTEREIFLDDDDDIIPEETQSLVNKEMETPNIALNDPLGKNSTYIKNSFLWKYIQTRDKNILNEHTTIDLLADLYIEINRYPEILASIFPNRVNRFPERELSVIWGKYETFITKWKRLIRDNKQEGFRDEDLELLIINLKRHLGNKTDNCSKIINLYKTGRLTYIEFIDQLTKELGRYSYKLALTMYEFSLILGGYVNFTNDILGKINNPSHQRYNPNYKLSIERLDDIKDNIHTILLNKTEKCFEIIKKYKDFNPDLKKYKHQQYTINNPRFFEVIDAILVAYFFGLLCADGYKSSSSYKIGIELSTNDKDRLLLFAESIGFDISRIKDRVRFYRVNGVLKSSQMSVLSFICKDMYNDLDNNQFSEYKKYNIGLPNCILESIRKAKQEAFENGADWMDTYWGKVALAFLLGFYDGDGTLDKRENQICARIYSSNKDFLDQVKDAFEIKNDVLTNTEPGEIRYIFGEPFVSRGYYLLTLGVKVFTGMLNSFSDSMPRKRPIKYRNS